MVDIAADNDVVLKATSYRVADELWPEPARIGVLATAKYVVVDRIARGRVRDQVAAAAAFGVFLKLTHELEPTDEEEVIALNLEVAAQEARLPLDAGESLLAAIAAVRDFAYLDTGDKRAIASLDLLADRIVELQRLERRIRSLEQLVLRAIPDDAQCRRVASRICAERAVDRALSICFACFSAPPERDRIVEGLRSYIADLRGTCPRLLASD
ncbi:MAG: hypothetical protein KGK34_09545 [Chloroflexota bacterium]|nr:hypothetical protein [Chloroflexota bacterium]